MNENVVFSEDDVVSVVAKRAGSEQCISPIVEFVHVSGRRRKYRIMDTVDGGRLDLPLVRHLCQNAVRYFLVAFPDGINIRHDAVASTVNDGIVINRIIVR